MTISVPMENRTRAYELMNNYWSVIMIHPEMRSVCGLLALSTTLQMSAVHRYSKQVVWASVEWLVMKPMEKKRIDIMDVHITLMNSRAYYWEDAGSLRCRSVWLRVRVMREPICVDIILIVYAIIIIF